MPVSMRPSPTVRGRRLRYELRRLREQRGLTIEQVAERSDGDWTASAISRWETGDRRIRPADLRRAPGHLRRRAATSARCC